jgi:hypothetical protein
MNTYAEIAEAQDFFGIQVRRLGRKYEISGNGAKAAIDHLTKNKWSAKMTSEATYIVTKE